MSWYQLLGIYHAAAELQRLVAADQPQACPNDGEPLESTGDGSWHCRYGGEIWSGTQGSLIRRN